MPAYDYECQECGVFTAFRPMSDYLAPASCPHCAAPAPRVLLSAPAIAGMDPSRRLAIATNERSSHEPRHSSAGRHRAGCSCCGGKSKRTKAGGDGMKAFPKSRPWMISH